MKFYSTNNKDHRVSLEEAVLGGLAPDNGLYMPEQIPMLPASFLNTLESKSFKEVAFTVAQAFVEEDLPTDVLEKIIDHTVRFDAPLAGIGENIFALELFHGPTMAFKDYGARFMSQLLGYFSRRQKKEIVILAATSGDTGSAVANGFLGVEGTRVMVLYPSGKVSEVQEKQFTTLGRNVTAFEVSGTFDDCQRLVKAAFRDEELRNDFFLTSANSINIARLIPQSFYYFHAVAQLKDKSQPVVFSVPSGNFGNLTAGLLAKRMGLPVRKFIVSTNINDIVPLYLETGIFKPRPSEQTISNAMDVGNPSNFARIMDLYDHHLEALCGDVAGYSFSDDETRQAMKEVASRYGYIMDPHGAVGFCGLKRYEEQQPPFTGIFLETAHPGKFREVVEETLQKTIDLPPALSAFMEGTKQTIRVSHDFEKFKATLKQIL